MRNVDRERDVEGYLVHRLETAGYPCIKFQPDHLPGMPDRMVLLPDGGVLWVELKTAGGRLSDLQLYRHRKLADIGHEVRVIWDKGEVDALIAELEKGRHL